MLGLLVSTKFAVGTQIMKFVVFFTVANNAIERRIGAISMLTLFLGMVL